MQRAAEQRGLQGRPQRLVTVGLGCDASLRDCGSSMHVSCALLGAPLISRSVCGMGGCIMSLSPALRASPSISRALLRETSGRRRGGRPHLPSLDGLLPKHPDTTAQLWLRVDGCGW